MEKIIIKKQAQKGRMKRTSVVVKPETYVKVYELAHEVNQPVETIVDLLLTEALKHVEIQN